MPCSLEAYRQRIGEFQFCIDRTKYCKSSPCSPRKNISVMFGRTVCRALIICVFILILKTYGGIDNGQRKMIKENVVFHGISNVKKMNCECLSMIGGSIFKWMSKKKINKLVHISNGNRGKQGKGITCIYWNKGSSLLRNKHEDIKQIIQDHKTQLLIVLSLAIQLGL